jgi:hypothetical protein
VLPKEETEAWAFAQIEGIVAGYLEQGAEEQLREMIAQQLQGADRFDASELSTVRQRQADIEATIENLLDNITPTNREYVDRRIAKLREETLRLEEQEAALQGQQGQEHQAEELARAAFALAPQVKQIAAHGTVEEKRTFLRAFVKEIAFDPASRTGTGYFYAVPLLDGDGGHDGGGGTRYHQHHADSPPEEPEGTSGAGSSLPLQNVGTRYTPRRTAPGEGGSSLIMVAGAGCADEENTCLRRWIVETAFKAPQRALQTVSRCQRMGDAEPVRAPQRPKVAGW